MSAPRKVFVVLLLAAFFTTPWASAARPRPERPQPLRAEMTPQVLFSRAWGFLEDIWRKTGCHIDPNGLCVTDPVPAPVPATGGTECGIDPSGNCVP